MSTQYGKKMALERVGAVLDVLWGLAGALLSSLRGPPTSIERFRAKGSRSAIDQYTPWFIATTPMLMVAG
jgi:hypothetical protein